MSSASKMFRRATLPSRPDLVYLYWVRGRSFGEIADQYKMTLPELRARFKLLGVLMRRGTPQEARAMMLWPTPLEYERQRLKALVGE